MSESIAMAVRSLVRTCVAELDDAMPNTVLLGKNQFEYALAEMRLDYDFGPRMETGLVDGEATYRLLGMEVLAVNRMNYIGVAYVEKGN